MRFAAWNINGIRARGERLDSWLSWRQPHTLALQEIRCPARSFPADLFEQHGYRVAVAEHVALASRAAITDIVDLLSDGRTLLATTADIRTISVYAPNGTKAGTPQHEAKLAWFDALTREVAELMADDGPPILLMGDLNIARDDRDVWAPDRYRTRNLFTPGERERLDDLLTCGLCDLFRQHHEGGGAYTWWNYAHDSFKRNHGWRLDYLLGSPEVARRSQHVVVDVQERALARTSDHAPLWVDLSD